MLCGFSIIMNDADLRNVCTGEEFLSRQGQELFVSILKGNDRKGI